MSSRPDIICLSHLRWGFVFQRPNHLISRFAKSSRVFFVEEPVETEGAPCLATEAIGEMLTVVTPQVPPGLGATTRESLVGDLLNTLVRDYDIQSPILWFYTPMALPTVRDIRPSLVVYDCMDELSGFLGAPPELLDREEALLRAADIVFTGGQSLYEAKRHRHPDVHAFPSSVDAAHFAQARAAVPAPADQATIPCPRVGYFGVIDERLDLALLSGVAQARPHLQFVMVGPVVKIDPHTLPKAPNIHWLGQKSYDELPRYLAGWDVAMMPFALNAATRFISPTKTLEYLAAGRPVVSTAVHDVVNPYGTNGLVIIADPSSFARGIDTALALNTTHFRARADEALAKTSWDMTFERMAKLVDHHLQTRLHASPRSTISTQESANV